MGQMKYGLSVGREKWGDLDAFDRVGTRSEGFSADEMKYVDRVS